MCGFRLRHLDIYNKYTDNMVKIKLSIKQMRTFAIILTVVFCGVGLFDIGFSYLYKEALDIGSCELCFELNPAYAHCENWEPVKVPGEKYIILNNNTPYVSYGE